MSHDHPTAAGQIIGQIRATRISVDAYLLRFPSSRVAHYAAGLEQLANAISVVVAKEEERAKRQADNARDRQLRSWEPHQVRAAARMGFADPADWRQYIDEREGTHPAEFPTPEEWRRERGIA